MNEPAAPPEPEGDLLDTTELDALAELAVPGEPSPVVELIDIFLAATPPRLQELRDAVVGGDAERVRKAAHSIKGGAGSLGARALAAATQVLESAGGRGDLSDAPRQLARADELYASTRAALLRVRAAAER